ncbi:MAG: hypothetical protein A3E87_09010 [Gammaproteobacteria bacterium RIFCSPHIGHO2_12_FULL_35_23]|nr:MAG: hypothetical protein A3E87_09010 [Gammaproteobacteria bacterium RIFCSPHIGHO2_12_FULL_35_23]
MINRKDLLTALHLDKPLELIFPFCNTLWALWIAAVGVPSFKSLIIFLLGIIILHALINFSPEVIKKQQTKVMLLSNLHKIELAALLILFIAALILLTNWLTIVLTIVGAIFFIIYLFLSHYHKNEIASIFYSLTWAWLTPLAFTIQNKDIEAITWLLFLSLFCWYFLTEKVRNLTFSNEPINLLSFAIIKLIVFILFIITGTLSGQSIWFFVGLIFTLILFIFQLDLFVCKKIKQAYSYYKWLSLVLLIGIILSYHL